MCLYNMYFTKHPSTHTHTHTMLRVPNHVTTLGTLGNRIFVGDLQEGFFLLRYRKMDNKMYAFAEVVGSRYVTAGLPLDYDTVAGADKFGNFFINRLPADVSAEVSGVVGVVMWGVVMGVVVMGGLQHGAMKMLMTTCQPCLVLLFVSHQATVFNVAATHTHPVHTPILYTHTLGGGRPHWW